MHTPAAQKADTSAARLKQIEGFATTLAAGHRVMDQRRHILEPLLRDEGARKALAAKVDHTHGAHAFNHLVPLLGQGLVNEAARLLLDPDRRVASFVNTHRKAAEPELHAALRKRFSEFPDKWHKDEEPMPGIPPEMSKQFQAEWWERDKEDFAESFDSGWKVVCAAIDQITRDSTSDKLLQIRNKYIAHLEMAPLHSDPAPFDVRSVGLTFNEILDFLDRYYDPVFELVRVITGSVYDVNGYRDTHKRAGSSMWRRIAGVPD